MESSNRVGPYRLEELLGEGGLGRVYRARHEVDGRSVAVKVLKAERAAYAQRFARELRAARDVTHRHLVEVLDSGEVDGRPFLVSRYVDGPSLDRRLEKGGPLPVGEALSLTAQVATGLDALHRASIVHRDVKPSNILLDPERGAVLTDFGLAKREDYTALTTEGQLVGTIGYIAPEAFTEEEPGSAADIYGLGCVVFECLAGHPPFSGRSALEMSFAHLHDEPPDPCAGRLDAPPDLGRFALTALAKDPRRRPPTAVAYANLLLASARES
jgi:serine/threonine-protein kinase